jgi:hypothetical protein
MGHETGVIAMSLIEGARELARNEYQMGCAVEHVFLAALPPYSFRYLDDEARKPLNIFTGDTLEKWRLQVQAKLKDFKDPPPIGQDSVDLKEALTQAQNDPARAKRGDERSLLLAVVMRTSRIQDYIESANKGDLKKLLDKLNELEGADAFAASGVKDSLEEEEAKRARENLDDLLKEIPPSPDQRYAELSAIDVKTFLDNLADASEQAHVLVAIGRDGTLINELPKVLADRLQRGNTFAGQQTPLNAYTGKLYRMDLRTVIDRARQEKTFKPVTALKEAWKRLNILPEKPILLLDHIEALRTDKDQGKEGELDAMRAQIADPRQLLVFGIFHAPNHGDHTGEATLNRPDTVITQPMNTYDEKQTKALIQQFYLKYWQKEGRGYVFAPNAFDTLIKLEPGAWVHRRRMVLPCLVTEVVSDAMATVALGDAQIEASARCALDAFELLRKEEAPGHPEKGQFEPILNKAEKEIRELLPSSGGGAFGRLFGGGGKAKVAPGKPIRVTSAYVTAELICHNVSEFHYPNRFPFGITEEV